MNRPNVRVIDGSELIKFILGEISAAEERNAAAENRMETEEREECDCDNCLMAEFCSDDKNGMASDEVNDAEGSGLEAFLNILNILDVLGRTKSEEEADEEEDKEEEVDGLGAFLLNILGRLNEEECDCEDCRGCDDLEDSLDYDYNYIDIIDEFSAGFKGSFVSEQGDEYKYDHDSKTLLFVAENIVQPASMTTELVNSLFAIIPAEDEDDEEVEAVLIPADRVLEFAMKGLKVKFSVDVLGTEVKGYVTAEEEGIAVRVIDNRTILRPSNILPIALREGTWTI